MTRKNRFIGTLFVLGTIVQNYLAQISHVPSEQIAKWTIHDWTGALLFVTLAGMTAWKAFLQNPQLPPAQ